MFEIRYPVNLTIHRQVFRLVIEELCPLPLYKMSAKSYISPFIPLRATAGRVRVMLLM